jgi:hypothetical protein
MKISMQGLLVAMGALVWWTGCASIGPPEAPSLELPKPPTDLHASRKGDRVTLTWTVPPRTTDRQSVRYLGKTTVCRSVGVASKQCGTKVGEEPPPAGFEEAKKKSTKKLSATFIDALPAALEREHPNEFAQYAVEVLNEAGRGAGISNQARVSLIPTLPPFPDFAAQAIDQGVRLSWGCPAKPDGAKETQYRFRINRRPEAGGSETKVADVDATACAVGRRAGAGESAGSAGDTAISSFLDTTFEWENTYLYRGAVVSVIETAGKASVEVEGDDTPSVKIFAHDVFPPAVPAGLQAVFSGPGQQAFIDLIWTPVSDADLDGYNIYRHEAGATPVKLNAELVKTPAFRDSNVVTGKTYFYSVSAVDQRGNESARSEETSEKAGNL